MNTPVQPPFMLVFLLRWHLQLQLLTLCLLLMPSVSRAQWSTEAIVQALGEVRALQESTGRLRIAAAPPGIVIVETTHAQLCTLLPRQTLDDALAPDGLSPLVATCSSGADATRTLASALAQQRQALLDAVESAVLQAQTDELSPRIGFKFLLGPACPDELCKEPVPDPAILRTYTPASEADFRRFGSVALADTGRWLLLSLGHHFGLMLRQGESPLLLQASDLGAQARRVGAYVLLSGPAMSRELDSALDYGQLDRLRSLLTPCDGKVQECASGGAASPAGGFGRNVRPSDPGRELNPYPAPEFTRFQLRLESRYYRGGSSGIASQSFLAAPGFSFRLPANALNTRLELYGLLGSAFYSSLLSPLNGAAADDCDGNESTETDVYSPYSCGGREPGLALGLGLDLTTFVPLDREDYLILSLGPRYQVDGVSAGAAERFRLGAQLSPGVRLTRSIGECTVRGSVSLPFFVGLGAYSNGQQPVAGWISELELGAGLDATLYF